MGIVRGSLYTMLSIGLALVFSTGGVLNLAHGAYYMLGAYFTYIYSAWVFKSAGGVSLLAAMAASIATVGILGLFIFYVLLRQLRIQAVDYILATTLALSFFGGEILAHFFGVTGTHVPSLIGGSSSVFGVRVINQELLVLPVAAVVMPSLWAFLKYTKAGQAIIAVAQNREGAILMGVNVNRTLALVMFVSAALAALAGALISAVRLVTPDMWVFPLIKSFAIVIIGGLGSLPGAVVGSFVLGFAEVATSLRFGEQFSELVSLALIVTILLLRPAGLFGK